MLIRIVLQAPPIPVPAISALLPATPDAPTWTHVAAQLAVMKGIIEEAPDDFPVFTMPNASHPSTFARIVDIPSSTSSLPQVAQNEARELQNAGVYNAMGFIVVIVKVFEMAESDTADGSLYEAANTASNLMTMALRVAPELVLLGLEKMGVSQSLRFTQMLIFAGATTSTRACEQGTFVEQLSCWRTRR